MNSSFKVTPKDLTHSFSDGLPAVFWIIVLLYNTSAPKVQDSKLMAKQTRINGSINYTKSS